jgi:hypothetical protein
MVRLVGVGKLKNPVTSAGIDPTCSLVPQQTKLPRVPVSDLELLKNGKRYSNCMLISFCILMDFFLKVYFYFVEHHLGNSGLKFELVESSHFILNTFRYG